MVREAWSAFERESREGGRGLPGYVRATFEQYLRCGLLEHGCVRACCAGCRTSRLVAFSCKRRGVCPSCNARRMCDLAARWVDQVVPEVAVRQWGLSFPFAWRIELARSASLLRAMVRTFAREIERFLLEKTRSMRRGGRARFGAITTVQRFGGSLNLHVHLHVLVLDGVYEALEGGALRWVEAEAPGVEELASVAARVAAGCERAARRWMAKNPGARAAVETSESEAPDAMEACRRAGIAPGRVTRGTGEPAVPTERAAQSFRLSAPRRWGASVGGFDLHAEVRVEASQRGVLEKLCRYVLRPPFALERLSVGRGGELRYNCKERPGGAPRVRVLDAHELLARLAALVPPPRYPDVRYHGVLAPNAAWRARIVPARCEPTTRAGCEGERRALVPVGVAVEASSESGSTGRDRVPWAELLRRIYGIDALRCPACEGQMSVISVLFERAAVQSILVHVGPEGTGPPRAPPSNEASAPVAVGH